MNYLNSFALASRKYYPAAVRILFVAEAPPACESKRFFYFTGLRQGDTLFLEMMKTLYPAEVGYSGERCRDGFPSRTIRLRKPELLNRFKSDGFYLIDACEQPMPQGANTALKVALMQEALPALKAKVRLLCSAETTGVLLIGAVTYDVCVEALRDEGLNVLNKAAINHPARGGQVLFRTKLRAALNALL
ncbi:hypothetical protein GOB94_15365 [Granulicella sp. 5B5]|uniref:hypothetical protein n=1 Tax=Granulicella sp. 5B5 TaxID=1617967 RepID=UPI0015F66889|nr:hypothetical protein [Granulicella sp. 5B5]QMV19905.1 hypothetical protein GOB94_15365 [Granulicella sp. 5B5]